MKTRFTSRHMLTALVVTLLAAGCSNMSSKPGAPASKASPEATSAIASATAAIKVAKSNNWIWRDTEQLAEEAQLAADKGENAVAIKLAIKAKAEADNAVAQYNYEMAHPRGM